MSKEIPEASGPFKGGVIALDVFTKIFCKEQTKAGLSDYILVGTRCDECPFFRSGGCLVRGFKEKYWPEYDNFGPFGGDLRW